jgi:predicted metal-dependent enzyme (double-stranded beta helix superfamily)
MAKALLGTFHSDQRTSVHLLSENTRLRMRVRELEDLVSRLKDENDRLAQAEAVALLELQAETLKEMQPV